MVTTMILLTSLLLASTILISASEQWEARRKAAAAAATMARAAAQGDAELIRSGGDGIDPQRAHRRVAVVVAALDAADPGSTYGGRIVAISGPVVSAEATVSVDYTFGIPGFPAAVSGSASAEAVKGWT